MGYKIADFGTFYLHKDSFPQPVPKVNMPQTRGGDIPVYEAGRELSLIHI